MLHVVSKQVHFACGPLDTILSIKCLLCVHYYHSLRMKLLLMTAIGNSFGEVLEIYTLLESQSILDCVILQWYLHAWRSYNSYVGVFLPVTSLLHNCLRSPSIVSWYYILAHITAIDLNFVPNNSWNVTPFELIRTISYNFLPEIVS